MTNRDNQSPRSAEDQEARQAKRVVRDGALAIKVWENQSDEGRPYYKVTLDKVYTDKKTGETRRSRSFDQADLLKLQNMAPEAYKAISELRRQDREMRQSQTPNEDVQRARDRAFEQEPQRPNGRDRSRAYHRRPDQY